MVEVDEMLQADLKHVLLFLLLSVHALTTARPADGKDRRRLFDPTMTVLCKARSREPSNQRCVFMNEDFRQPNIAVWLTAMLVDLPP